MNHFFSNFPNKFWNLDCWGGGLLTGGGLFIGLMIGLFGFGFGGGLFIGTGLFKAGFGGVSPIVLNGFGWGLFPMGLGLFGKLFEFGILLALFGKLFEFRLLV